MKIWITGIAGFLGGHLAEQLIKEGHQVFGNDSLVCGSHENIPMGAEYYGRDDESIPLTNDAGNVIYPTLDCCDYDGMAALLKGIKPDVLIHCACTAHEGFSPYSPHTITSSTYGGSISTFSAAISAGVKRIVFMSTMARYGKGRSAILAPDDFVLHPGKIIKVCSGEPPFGEDTHTPAPCDPYGIAKVAAEQTLINLCETHGVKWSIVVPHNIIGTRQKYDDPYRNVVSIFMNRMLQGKPAVIYGDGEQTRCFSPIGDVLPSIIKAVNGEIDGEIVNIGPDSDANKMTINELAAKIGNLTGYNGKPEYHPERGCDAKHAHCSSDKARKLLGFEATHDLDACFKEMIEDIRAKGTKPFSYFLPIEIDSPKTPKTWKERLL